MHKSGGKQSKTKRTPQSTLRKVIRSGGDRSCYCVPAKGNAIHQCAKNCSSEKDEKKIQSNYIAGPCTSSPNPVRAGSSRQVKPATDGNCLTHVEPRLRPPRESQTWGSTVFAQASEAPPQVPMPWPVPFSIQSAMRCGIRMNADCTVGGPASRPGSLLCGWRLTVHGRARQCECHVCMSCLHAFRLGRAESVFLSQCKSILPVCVIAGALVNTGSVWRMLLGMRRAPARCSWRCCIAESARGGSL